MLAWSLRVFGRDLVITWLGPQPKIFIPNLAIGETALVVKPDLTGFFRKVGHTPTHSLNFKTPFFLKTAVSILLMIAYLSVSANHIVYPVLFIPPSPMSLVQLPASAVHAPVTYTFSFYPVCKTCASFGRCDRYTIGPMADKAGQLVPSRST